MATNLNALVLKIGADTSGVAKGVRAVRTDINRINGVMRSQEEMSHKLAKATASLSRIHQTGALSASEMARAVATINEKYSSNISGANKYASAIERAKKSVARTVPVTEHLKQEFRDVRTAANQGAITNEEYSRTLTDIKGRMKALKDAQSGATETTRRLNEQRRQEEVRLERVASEVRRNIPETTRLAQKIRELRQAHAAGKLTTQQFVRANQSLRQSYVAAKNELNGVAEASRKAADRLSRVRSAVNASVPAADRLEREARELHIELRRGNITAKEYSRTLSRLKTQYGANASQASAFGTVLGGVGGQALAATGGLLSVYGAINFVREGFRDSFAMERATNQLAIFTGSLERGQQLVNNIDRFAGATPLTFNGLAQSSTLLAGARVPAELLMDRMRRLGDVSMGNTDRFNRLALAYSQVLNKSRLMGQEANQLREAGFQPLQVISSRTGESIAELTKRMEGGGIAASEVTKALIDATNSGGQFHGMLDKMSDSTEGRVNQMVNAFERMRRKFVDTFGESIAAGAELTTFLIETLPGAIKIADEATSGFVTGTLGGLPGVINNLNFGMISFGLQTENLTMMERLHNRVKENIESQKGTVEEVSAAEMARAAQIEKIAERNNLIAISMQPITARYQEQNEKLRATLALSERQAEIAKRGIQLVELAEARKAGATETHLAQLRLMQRENTELSRQAELQKKISDAKEKQQEKRLDHLKDRRDKIRSDADALKTEAERIREKFRTPFQDLTAELVRLNQMRSRGLINSQNFEKSKNAAQKQFGQKQVPVKVELPPTVTKGSREEYQLIAKSQSNAAQNAARQHVEAMAVRQAQKIAAERAAQATETANEELRSIEVAIRSTETMEAV